MLSPPSHSVPQPPAKWIETTTTKKKRRPRVHGPGTCLLDDCHESFLKVALKIHALTRHVPDLFCVRKDPVVETPSRIAALNMIATLIFGKSTGLDRLMALVSANLQATVLPVVVTPGQKTAMLAVCKHLGLEPPAIFTIHPINSPAAMIHWRVVYMLITLLSAPQRDQLYRAFPLQPRPPAPEESLEEREESAREGMIAQKVGGIPDVEQETHVLEIGVSSADEKAVIGEEESVGAEAAVGKEGEVFDSHFHLNRCRGMWLVKSIPGYTELLGKASEEVTCPCSPENLIGAVANYVDPDSWPDQAEIDELVNLGVRVTVGVHPKLAWMMNDKLYDQLQDLLANPLVSGLGEIGLDHQGPMGTWDSQRQMFEKLLPWLDERHVLVLHGRGMNDTVRSSYSALETCFVTVTKHVTRRDQHMHVHCYTGVADTVRAWLKVFPNAYFGFTNLVNKFGDEQKEAVRAVPINRLLVETDAPYFSGKTRRSSPLDVERAVEAVRKVRGETREYVRQKTTENALTLYPSRV